MLEVLGLQLCRWSTVEDAGEAWQGQGYPPRTVVPQQPCTSPCPAGLCGSVLVLVLPGALLGLGWGSLGLPENLSHLKLPHTSCKVGGSV